jgi:hypothetical protein
LDPIHRLFRPGLPRLRARFRNEACALSANNPLPCPRPCGFHWRQVLSRE